MTQGKSKSFSNQQKVAILKEHLIGKRPVADLCESYGVNLMTFYSWRRKFFENGEAAFRRVSKIDNSLKAKVKKLEGRVKKLEGKVKKLEGKVKKLEDEVQSSASLIGEITEEYIQVKKGIWADEGNALVAEVTRDQVVDFVDRINELTKIPMESLISWLDITKQKFYGWKKEYGKADEDGLWNPPDSWILDHKRRAVIEFAQKHPRECYPDLISMVIDQDIATLRRSSVY